MSWIKAVREAETKADDFVPVNTFPDFLPRTRYPYGRDVKQGLRSNVVMAPIFWITRNFTQATTVVEQLQRRMWEQLPEHELAALLKAPNPFYSASILWKATLVSLCLDGNSYWQKVRNRFQEVVGYWYLPHFRVEPKWPQDGSTFISHYEYRPTTELGVRPRDLDVRDVVHFRYEGLDPENPRKGLSPVKTLLREVFTDEEASNFSASILRNMGVPGGLIAPKDASGLPKKDDIEEMREYMRSGFTGDKRGEWLVLGVPTDVKQFGFDPSQLLLANLRDISEERTCAVLGIPAAVVGFGAGLQQTKVGATLQQLRQAAWHNAIIPMQNDLAEQLTLQAVPDFATESPQLRVTFDRSRVSAFQEEETEKAKRIALYVEKGILRVDRAQELAGLEVDPDRALYMQPNQATPIPAEGSEGATDDKEGVPAAIADRMGRNGPKPQGDG